MPNALAHEKSPYLLQHAENPVDWLPWSEAAFAKARAEQKPIFLSIGYATCHWCHVMAHESFENEALAALLNASFVPIKVDREERPDVDRVYMTYVQAMTGHGGWPLSAWLTPDLKPFFGGTYFPPEDRHGRPGFGSILRAIAGGWANERDKLVAEGERVIDVLREHHRPQPAAVGAGGPPAGENSFETAAGAAFERCFQHFYEAFDPNHAGFGSAPKFPRASNLTFLFRVAALQGLDSEIGAEAVKMAVATCRAMSRGGMHDHVGGGFHRYSVDESWFVPHFEKMLYDQAQIAVNALEAKQATGDERFAWMARDIFDYVRRDLSHPAGGFYSAEDADSPSASLDAGAPAGDTGVSSVSSDHARGAHATPKEGAFYVWTRAEIAAALGEDMAFFCGHFGVEESGNVPEQLDPHGELRGKNILAQRQTIGTTAQAFGLTPEQASDRLHAALQKLRALRERRPRPQRDDKIITAWNGLMISALAKAHQVLGEDDAGGPYLDAATRAAEFIRRELHDEQSGMLYRSWRDGRSAIQGFAEDYACLIQGLLDLYEAGFDVRWLQWAERLQHTMDELFWDAERGGYFNSRAGDPHIVLRLKEDYDGAEPAPSSVAAMNLLRLGAVFDDPAAAGRDQATKGGYGERGRRTIEAFRAQWGQAPHALPQMICALELALMPPGHVVLAGDPASEPFRRLQHAAHERLGRRRVYLAADGGEGQRWLAERAPWLSGMVAPDGRAAAYVCQDFTCQAPVDTPESLARMLAA